VNSQEIAAIMKLYLQGLNAEEIGKELGYTTKTISSFLYDEIKENSNPKQKVLKWIKFNEHDKTTYPQKGQLVLVSSFDGFIVCDFKDNAKFFINYLGNKFVLNKVYAWMPIFSPHFVDDMGITYVDAEINNEYLIEQTTLETFDIIDAITPALREAVKHLLVQQGASK
jgi:hypothetical protein